MREALAALALACALGGFACAPNAAKQPAVVVVGIDGMDPQLLDRFVARGLMPHFAALIEQGAYMPLETSVPPQSPVAWSNFITGMDPGGHGIFDFIHRDPQTYLPVFSAARVTEPENTFSIGEWVVPLSAGKTELLRKGEAFWQVLDRHRIPYQVIRVPANFPPAKARGVTLSGMGTPDLLGTYGTFTLYTDDPNRRAGDVAGGSIQQVRIERGRIEARLIGPESTLRKDRPTLVRPFTVDVDAENDAARITVGNESFVLATSEWSEWVHIQFDVTGPLNPLHGIARFHLRRVRPTFELYVTPLNMDPARPALPISTPRSYSRDLDEQIGAFYTQGMPEDTKALEAGALNDSEFVAQTEIVMSERWRMLDAVLDRYRGGFLFFYVSTVDQSCHALWRNEDPTHPAHTADLDFADRFEQLYAEMDSLLGVVRAHIPDDATLIVMSDHGFASYAKKFHLNTWLHQEGYLTLERPDAMGEPLFGGVFWRRTRAYGVGLNSLYLNLAGREAKGIVQSGAESDSLIAEISRKLLALRDPENGEPIVTRVYDARLTYHGTEVSNAPDLIVGYNRGYRGSDESALGTVTTSILTLNLGKWTGDHCMDHTKVPGVLLSNRPIVVRDPALLDLPVTILDRYGIATPEQMSGRVVLGR